MRWNEPVNGIAEIADMPETVLAAFSARTGGVERRLEAKLERFIDTFDRDPTPRERWKLEREAVLDSRPRKPTAVGAVDHHEDWAAQLLRLGVDPRDMTHEAIGRAAPPVTYDAAPIIEAALAAITEKQSTWRRAELTRELAAATPTPLATTAEALSRWLDEATDHCVAERCVDLTEPVVAGTPVRRDGRPISEPATARQLTTAEILRQEQRIVDWADERLARSATTAPMLVNLPTDRLTGAQVDVAEAVAGWNELVMVVGPAGTGKTSALPPAVAQLHADRRPVFGLALSASAAEVLASETGVAADTLEKLLTEHRPGHRPTAAINFRQERPSLSMRPAWCHQRPWREPLRSVTV